MQCIRGDDPIFKWISITNRFTQIYLNRELKPYGINFSQHMFVLLICENPGITNSQLQQQTIINKSNVARATIQLDKQGFITRKINAEDKRVMHNYPTAKGEQVYPLIVDVIEEWDHFITQSLSSPEKAKFIDFCKSSTAIAFNALQDELER